MQNIHILYIYVQYVLHHIRSTTYIVIILYFHNFLNNKYKVKKKVNKLKSKIIITAQDK